MTGTAPGLRVFLTHTEEELRTAFADDLLAELEAHVCLVRNVTGRVLQGEELAREAKDCAVIVAHRSTAGQATTFAAAPDLVAFVCTAVDTSTIDVPAASAHGILVTNVSPGFADAVAELALGMMIDLARGVSRGWRSQASGEPPRPTLGTQLRGKTAGVVGYGRIGRRLGDLCRGVGMTVLVHDPAIHAPGPGVEALGLYELLARSDFVICLAAATPETRHLFGASAFAAMRPGSFFLNLSRGALVDDAALEASLDMGHLGGAGLDVGNAPDERPAAKFFARLEVLATPHIGGVTAEARRHQAIYAVDQVKAIAAGTVPEGAVNLDAACRLQKLLQARGANS